VNSCRFSRILRIGGPRIPASGLTSKRARAPQHSSIGDRLLLSRATIGRCRSSSFSVSFRETELENVARPTESINGFGSSNKAPLRAEFLAPTFILPSPSFSLSRPSLCDGYRRLGRLLSFANETEPARTRKPREITTIMIKRARARLRPRRVRAVRSPRIKHRRF
jgi:hypothetical protein